MTQQLDLYGQPLAGGQLFIIQAATVATPQNPYQDAGLTLVMPNPITLDASGRVPQFFLADGYIKVRLVDVNGVTQLAADGILVIGPSAGGGGGGGTVDPTSVMQTGDMKFRYDIAILSGFVRANGKSLGSASSGATELADPSAQALFNYLWNKDTTLAVTPSRGATSAADWAANKQIATPDFRGYAPTCLDGMGNALAGRLTSAYFGAASADVLGAIGGGESWPLSLLQIPTGITSNNPANAISVLSTVADIIRQGGSSIPGGFNQTGGFGWGFTGTPPTVQQIQSIGNNAINVTSNNTGGQAHRTVGPRKLITFYLKL